MTEKRQHDRSIVVIARMYEAETTSEEGCTAAGGHTH